MNGPTIVRALFGSVRRTSKAPMSCVEGVMTIILFSRRDGLDRKRMDALAGQVAERLVDRALARHAIHSGEARPSDGQAAMRLAAAVVAGMAMLARAVVAEGELSVGKGRGEADFHRLLHGAVVSAGFDHYHPNAKIQ